MSGLRTPLSPSNGAAPVLHSGLSGSREREGAGCAGEVRGRASAIASEARSAGGYGPRGLYALLSSDQGRRALGPRSRRRRRLPGRRSCFVQPPGWRSRCERWRAGGGRATGWAVGGADRGSARRMVGAGFGDEGRSADTAAVVSELERVTASPCILRRGSSRTTEGGSDGVYAPRMGRTVTCERGGLDRARRGLRGEGPAPARLDVVPKWFRP